MICYLVSAQSGCSFCVDLNEGFLDQMQVNLDQARSAREAPEFAPVTEQEKPLLRPCRTPMRSTAVTKGPYQFSRNPLYLGLLMLLTGLAFGLASLPACLVLPGLFLALQLEFVDAGEIRLQQRFGQHYLRYREQVPRWL